MTISTYEFSSTDLQDLIDGLSPEEMNFTNDTLTDWNDEELDYLFWTDQWMGNLPYMTMGYGPIEPSLQGPLLPTFTDHSFHPNDPNSF